MNKTPHQKMLNSLLSSSASSIGEKLGEVAIDSVMTASVLKDIPIIGTALNLFEAGNDVKAYLFIRKITKFLTEVEQASFEKRKEFLSKLNEKEKSNLGDTLLLVLDSIKEMKSSSYLGRSFMLLTNGDITFHTFNIYSHIIANLSDHLLEQLKFIYQFENFIGISSDSMHFLNGLGLLEIKWKVTMGREAKLRPVPEQNELGKKFYKEVIVGCTVST